MILTVDSDLNGASPQFTLTCISTDGPATTVTWTRDSVTITEGTNTELDNTVTAQYTHTLTVTERLGGLYTCTVTNDKPSSASATINIQGIIHTVQKYNLEVINCTRDSAFTNLPFLHPHLFHEMILFHYFSSCIQLAHAQQKMHALAGSRGAGFVTR